MSRWGVTRPALQSPPTPGIHRFADAGLRHACGTFPVACGHSMTGEWQGDPGVALYRCYYIYYVAAGRMSVVAA